MTSLAQRNQKMAIKLAVIALLMFGFGYALSPLYVAFCKALGIDQAQASITQSSAALRLEFDTNVASGVAATIQALDTVQMAQAGGIVKTRFLLANTSDQPLKLRAIPSFAPVRAAGLLQKLECFCFDELVLQANERREVTVVLLVADQLPAEMGAATLSYSLQAVAQ
ncbi:cytochrome c oxidase assembly protein [Deefgea tanakiae]|uniref:Cytochrome c oxidase assembly protein CtaG n=1 Tax=Deefgea tanakiae TaxID=2865840 RepID=A0ABX8Z440_9NEIS|nr:cytochrome c oxidase assembly protein [Deefgea tanakiae]QZA77343.1 cytochrome c oxidase assembly protein [Deefgea tanakiae]